MGGHAAGEVASATAARWVHEQMLREQSLLAECRANPTAALRQRVLEALEAAVCAASAEVFRMAQAERARRGMGTTLSALLLLGHRGFMAHVGDSRVYLYRHSQIHQLSEDHSLVNELLKRGQLSSREIAELPVKNAVTRAVGVHEEVEVDTADFDVLEGDRFLLCSDGLHGYLEPESLQRFFDHPHLNQIPEMCVAFANRSGGKDNVSVVLVEVGEQDEQGRADLLRLGMSTLRKAELFRYLPYSDLARVMSVAAHAQYAAGESVFDEGSEAALHLVLAGSVKVQRGQQRLGRYSAGMCFGLHAVLGAAPKHLQYVAERASSCLTLTRRDFLELLRHDHRLAARLLWNMAQILAHDSRDLAGFGEHRSSAELLALWDVAADSGEITAPGKAIGRPSSVATAAFSGAGELVPASPAAGRIRAPASSVLESSPAMRVPSRGSAESPDAEELAFRRPVSHAVTPLLPGGGAGDERSRSRTGAALLGQGSYRGGSFEGSEAAGAGRGGVRRGTGLAGDDEETLPPQEMLARRTAQSKASDLSVSSRSSEGLAAVPRSGSGVEHLRVGVSVSEGQVAVAEASLADLDEDDDVTQIDGLDAGMARGLLASRRHSEAERADTVQDTLPGLRERGPQQS
jgi:serine/threonine protein phosphatase PrpC